MTVFVDDPDFTLHVGDALDVLAGLPDESVHCVVTSPPYWGLRDYGTSSWDGGDEHCDHKQGRNGSGRADGVVDDRAQRNRDGAAALTRQVCRCGARRIDHQLGLEPTADEYVANMVNVFREVRRVLRRDGTCWLNIGDSYAGSWGAQSRERLTAGDLAYGPGGHVEPASPAPAVNLSGTQIAAAPKGTHTGSWVKGHPTLKPKDLVGIPWRLAFALQADGWYLRSDIIWAKPNPMPESVTDRPTKTHEYLFLLTRSPRYYYDADAIREDYTPDDRLKRVHDHHVNGSHENHAAMSNGKERWAHGGRNKRSVWEIATQPYPEAHFATFPQSLVEPCVKAGCPIGGTVLDPFMGSGTTALVARRLSRRTIGIELSPEYATLAATRLQQLSLLADA